ncbi:hypothetical protein E2C01_063407 [Portunus trituberculatus]|uniref:Uncharacterized protein n=1 Tax=Portunus trituberculatus TaxID=210409 RepID=A0A5B7HDL5_PORTR|nr:hypothetical protein [Portunus trituberculatus]
MALALGTGGGTAREPRAATHTTNQLLGARHAHLLPGLPFPPFRTATLPSVLHANTHILVFVSGYTGPLCMLWFLRHRLS